MFSKRKKNILIVDRYNWLKIDYAAVGQALGAGYRLHLADFDQLSGPGFGVSNEKDLRTHLKYIKYELCVSLEIYPNRIDIEDPRVRSQVNHFASQAKACDEYFSTLLDKHDFHKVIIIQGHQYESSVIRSLCNERNVNVCSLENTFDKDKFLYDFISGVTVNRGIAKNIYYKYVDFVDSEVSENYCRSYREKVRAVKSIQHQSGSKKALKTSRKRIVFLGQVYTDASVLFGINDFKDPVEILEVLVDYVVANDFELFIKLHPKELDGLNTLREPYDSITLRKIKENHGLYEKIESNGVSVDYKNLDTYSLIETADLCVTINSQSGFEALAFGKEVVLCGRAFYSGLGLTYEAYDHKDLTYCMDRALKEGTRRNNPRQSCDLFYIMTNKYFLDKTISNYAEIFRK
jgi:hypothetical protein